MEQPITPVTDGPTRKRFRETEKWKRSIEKIQRYSVKGLPRYPKCGHRIGYQCQLLNMNDIKKFHDAFYLVPKKSTQDAFILKYCRALPPKRKRNLSSRTKEKMTTYEYTIPNEAGNNLKVCRDTFLNVLKITKHRVIGVFCRFKKDNSLVPLETRGGSRKDHIYNPQKERVINFICKFKAIESHYSRANSTRVYLPSELNIRKMWIMFNDSVEDVAHKVKQSFFRKVFCTNFNIGFATPAVDECSTCIELCHKVKIEKDETTKNDLKLKLDIHKKQASAFFDHLRRKPEDCFLMSFDCQKNLVLPKVSDQIAYYSRQLYCYNMSIVKGLSTDHMSRENVSIYSWMENEGKKSSNEIASIVYNELNSVDLSKFSTIRLVADGCAGQNKNVTMLTMCAKWLATCTFNQINRVELIFPVTGHSYMPSDRVFGMIERELKKITTIIKNEEYHNIFRKYGTLKLINKDWKPYDWKTEANIVTKTASQLHFKISMCKRLILRKTKKGNIFVSGELSYYSDTGIQKKITKGKHTLTSINPKELRIGVPLKEEKTKDIDKLLQKHFGIEWKKLEELNFYKEIVESDVHCEENDDCDCINMPVEDSNVVLIDI